MDVETARWLASAASTDVLALARDALDGRDALAAASWLRTRAPGLDPARAAAALDQAQLATLAGERYGLDVPTLLTRDGLEQATRPEVAARRAEAFAADGARRVVDLTAGLGFDARAFLAAGLEVVAVERDPATAALLAANAPGAQVLVGDALDVLPSLLPDLASTDVVFADPARRDPAGPRDTATGRARPERDPARWSPPWPAIAAIVHPRVAAKVAAALEPPSGWQGQWTSWERTVVEAQVASWSLSPAARTAVVLRRGADTFVVDAGGEPPLLAPDAPWPAWLHEPDPAVVRAGAVGRMAADLALVGLAPDSNWLAGDEGGASPALRSYRVVAELTGSAREKRRALAALGVERVVVKSRDVRVDPALVRRDLGVGEGGEHVVVLTRRGGRTVSMLAVPQR
ncbi:MAG: hypothetical protein U0R65_06325 [Candidatus Nanopelagicales bacterium]